MTFGLGFLVQINCLHGYFIFKETAAGQISRFISLFDGLEIEPVDDHFTFSDIAEAPKYSIVGKAYLDAVATETFEGNQWDVMRENGLIYNFQTGLVVQIETVMQRFEVDRAANFFVSNGLILPGSIRDDGFRVTDYSAFYNFSSQKFNYTEVTFE